MEISTLTRLAVLAVVLIAAPATSAPKSDSAEVCALGARILAEQAHRGANAFDGGAKGSAPFLQEASRRAEPPLSKAEWKLLDRPPENLFSRCPELTKQLPKGTRLATPQDLDALQKITRLKPLFVGTIYAPWITPDGSRALVYEAVRCAGLCGSGSFTAYRRVKGRWVQDRVIFNLMS